MIIKAGGAGPGSFCDIIDVASPGDVIEPPNPGKYIQTPWVYGDADTWGVHTAAIVLNNTDGAPELARSLPHAIQMSLGA